MVAKTKPPIPPKPQLKGGIPQNVLDSPPSSTNTTNGAQYRPIPKPRLHKPGPFNHTLNLYGDVGQASPDTDSPALNGSSESHTVPLACPACCPCACHIPDKNGPQKSEQYEDNHITNSGNNEEPRRVPPDMPIPTRPVPKETLQLSIINGNKTEPSSDALKIPSQKPVPTPRKWNAKKMVNIELSWLFSWEKDCFLLPYQKKNEDKAAQKQASCLRSQSFQTPVKCPEQSSAERLKVKRAKSCPNGGGKKKDGPFQELLQEEIWQECRVVKESGILNSLTPEEILLQQSIYEVATSEMSYLEGLNVIVNHFMGSSELTSSISSEDQKSLFSSIRNMSEISKKFLDSMVQEMGSDLICDALCDVVYRYASGPLDDYVAYIRNMPCQKNTLNNLRENNSFFLKILTKLEEDSCCNRLPLDSFLSLPFQRISHLKVLMETVCKRTSELQCCTQFVAQTALTKICEVLEKCNREVGKIIQIKDLVEIVNKIEFDCKSYPLVSSSRWFIRTGQMTLLATTESIFGQKKNAPVHLLLFNDLLLIAFKKGSDKYMVHDHVHRSLIEVSEGAEVEDLEGYDVSRVFQLAIVKKKGNSYQLLLQASSLEERNSWLKLLKSEEGVYEEWDCPQVQCIEAYNGQQPAELNLKPGDIVNIIQKTSDGLMEGRKLPGGERGWFPSKCVEEIVNEHVQRRNLRQRHHVLQTAASITKVNRIWQNPSPETTTCFNKP